MLLSLYLSAMLKITQITIEVNQAQFTEAVNHLMAHGMLQADAIQ